LCPYAVEPVNDIAVLGAVDGQVYPEWCEAFEDFCDATRPVPLALDGFRIGIACDAFVFTHDKGIVHGHASIWAENAPRIWIDADADIIGGTSGGPIVTRKGNLLGVLSSSGGTVGGPTRECGAARVLLAAPVWLVRRAVPPAKLVRLSETLDHRDVRTRTRQKGER
jgi:hypothetical protein